MKVNGYNFIDGGNKDGTQCSAIFSECMGYRYRLMRIWDASKKPLVFCMLNPSTADHFRNDPTVERCERRARSMPEVGGLEVINIFALRSTDPMELYHHAEPIGKHNNDMIIEVARGAHMLVCGWGFHGNLYQRGPEVLKLLREHHVAAYALKRTKDGNPAHPLYLPYTLQPVLLENS
jgi:hypothetical protein